MSNSMEYIISFFLILARLFFTFPGSYKTFDKCNIKSMIRVVKGFHGIRSVVHHIKPFFYQITHLQGKPFHKLLCDI